MQLKYGLIYGHPEAFVGKLRKIWIGEEVKKQIKTKSNVKAIVIDEAHLIVEWQVFDICFHFFMLLQYLIYNAVNTFDIFAVRIFLLSCSCKSMQVFSM